MKTSGLRRREIKAVHLFVEVDLKWHARFRLANIKRLPDLEVLLRRVPDGRSDAAAEHVGHVSNGRIRARHEK